MVTSVVTMANTEGSIIIVNSVELTDLQAFSLATLNTLVESSPK